MITNLQKQLEKLFWAICAIFGTFMHSKGQGGQKSNFGLFLGNYEYFDSEKRGYFYTFFKMVKSNIFNCKF